MKVKMCGMRRKEDIAYANEVKPDAVGYIFFPKSKRYVTGQQAKEFDQDLDQDILSVGVFVNETIEKVIEIANQVPLDVIQLHGDEDHTYIEQLKQQTDKEIWKVVRVKDTNDIKEAGITKNSFRFLIFFQILDLFKDCLICFFDVLFVQLFDLIFYLLSCFFFCHDILQMINNI